MKRGGEKIENFVVAFKVNPPEGTDHSLKCVKIKIGHIFTLKTFEISCLIKKKFKSKLIHLLTFSDYWMNLHKK